MKITLRIPDMHCPSCVLRLQGLEDDLPGVERVDGSYQKQRLDIVFDETRLSQAAIVAAIADLGYTVDRVGNGI